MALSEDYNSSRFANIQDSINHSKKNKIVISNVSRKINLQNKMIINDSPIFKQYEDIIMRNVEEIRLPEEFYYRPTHLSEELYGTPDLWYLLLWINKMTSAYEFNREKILVYDPSKLDILNRIINKESKYLKLTHKEPIYIEDLTLKQVEI